MKKVEKKDIDIKYPCLFNANLSIFKFRTKKFKLISNSDSI